jgi:hypothetical protein
MNSTRESKNFGITNEGSTEQVSAVGSDVVGVSYCEDRNWTFVFRANDSIWIYNHANRDYKEVMNAGEFGCKWNFNTCEWLGGQVEFSTMEPCSELYVYFSANCEYYHVNVDLMLDPDRKAGLKRELNCSLKCGVQDNCEYFKNFKAGCAPKINAKTYRNDGGGGNLKAGAYTFYARYLHIDKGETNWFHPSNAAFVGSEHNIAGEDTSSYIEVSLSGLDCKFASIELAVLEDIGGIKIAKTLNNFHHNSNKFSYRYNGTDGTPIDVRELLGKEHTYLRGKYLQQKDGHMLYYGIKSRRNPHLQPYANKIQTRYYIYEMPYSHAKKYNIRGLMRGETYAFAIVYNYIDGSHSKAFHIPGNPTGGGIVGDQKSSIFENFVEQPNDNANLPFTGGFSYGSGSQGTISNDITILCQFKDISTSIDLTYNAIRYSDADDELEIFITGFGEGQDFLNCIKKAVNDDGTANLYMKSYNDGEDISFSATSIISSSSSSITLGGKSSSSTSETQTAQTATGAQNARTASDAPFSGFGQSQGKLKVAKIVKRQELIRKREHKILDDVNNPQNDHYDDIIQNMIENLNTEYEDHLCQDIRLYEDHLMAHCCWCGSGGECEPGAAYQRCMTDSSFIEEGAANWLDLLNWYNLDELTPEYESTKN